MVSSLYVPRVPGSVKSVHNNSKQCLLDSPHKVMTAFWALKSNILNVYLLQVICDGRNQYKQTDIWMDVNGYVEVAVILSKIIFSSSNFFMHMFNCLY